MMTEVAGFWIEDIDKIADQPLDHAHIITIK
jgi:hypothetical protein